MSITINPAEDDRPAAVIAAGRAAELWADVVRLQRWADPHHSDFCAIAAELVATLQAMEDLAGLLARQVERYGNGQPLYDDSRTVGPAERLRTATDALQLIRSVVGGPVLRHTNRFWSAIAHIGVDTEPAGLSGDDGSVTL